MSVKNITLSNTGVRNRLNRIPMKPGVYLMRGPNGEILYVGKASKLKNRIRSYFTGKTHSHPKIETLVNTLVDFEFIITESEQEALILESNLIKSHKPKFNSRLKDDKSYPFIKIDVSEKFPQVYVTRNVSNDDARYFGPYTDAGSVRRTLSLLNKLFPYRSCTKQITGSDDRACLDFHIKRCVGPCIGAVDDIEYNKIIDQVILFLEGDTKQIVNSLRLQMRKAAESLKFEKAASLRDQLQSIEKVQQGQKVLTLKSNNMDIIGSSQSSYEAWIEVFFIRQGKLIGRENYLMDVGIADSISEVESAFLKQFYGVTPYVPPLILTQHEILEEKQAIQSFLSEKRGTKVVLLHPKRGDRKKLVDMVTENARLGMEQLRITRFSETDSDDKAMLEVQEALNLPKLPNRIECYDISNIQGTNAVGSMVVFENGSPKTSDYRRFQIKSVKGIDDYSMMREMLTRRFNRMSNLSNENTAGLHKRSNQEAWTMKPDLVLIDGGKGHLGAALQVFLEMGISDVPLASLAKENEELFTPESPHSILLPKNSPGMYLVQRARDEAHRFAITYHRKRRSNQSFQSSLDLIPGIGPKKRRSLLRKYGSIKNIKESSLEDIATTPGITLKLAEQILDHI